MNRTFALSAMLIVAPIAFAGEVESGLKKGAGAPAFTVLDVTGPKAGTKLCYR